jgi:L-lactate dehydrogenase (cytochrome)
MEVHLDTGIMSGADIVAAVALGADFTMVGRAYLYGLMAGGREGVDRMIQILSGEVARTMRLLGVATLDELEPKHVTQLARLVPVSPAVAAGADAAAAAPAKRAPSRAAATKPASAKSPAARRTTAPKA